ncbi:hypothetical protein V8E54_012033 [Elaphomyces granulatus]
MPFPVEKTWPLPFPQTRSAPFEYSWGSTGNNFPTASFSPMMRQDHLASSFVALPPSQTPFVLGPVSDRPTSSYGYDHDQSPHSFRTFIDGQIVPTYMLTQPEAETCGAPDTATAVGLVDEAGSQTCTVKDVKGAKSSCKGQKKRLSGRVMNVNRKLVLTLPPLSPQQFVCLKFIILNDERSSTHSTSSLKCRWEGCKYSGCFARGVDLMRHVKGAHIFPGSHVCVAEGCCKAFNRKDNLQAHITRSHQGNDEFHSQG